jgi:putative MATE family efflux protein
MSGAKSSTARDMTSGSIIKQILLFSLPLMFGNIFQMLYNTVDSIVVGNYVSTQALAAVGSTTMIINMLVFFFNGFSVGASVVISRFFGAKEIGRLHVAIETTMAATFIFCVAFTFIGIKGVGPMLRFMATPDDVFADASTYLTIYFAGITGLLIYNMGSGILRAVGDTIRPLFLLILTSIMNIILDLVFVKAFHFGIEGVAYATIISQFISAALILWLLLRTNDIYKLTISDLKIDPETMKMIIIIGLPTGIQSVITAFSNIFVQSYINYFGSDCMAGWSSYNKLDSFIMLPLQSMAMAATTFVSQNIGAGKVKRAEEGTRTVILMGVVTTGFIAFLLYIFARPAIRMFSAEQAVIDYGALFIHTNVFFLMFNCVNHTLASSLRGRGDSTGPMIIMISTFVVLRQTYLYILTHYISNTPKLVGFGYPVGWMSCCLVEVSYYLIRYKLINKGAS